MKLVALLVFVCIMSAGCEQDTATEGGVLTRHPIHIDLQNGFEDDSIEVSLNWSRIFSGRFTTIPGVELATSRKITMPDGPYTLSVTTASGLVSTGSEFLHIQQEKWIGVSLVRDEGRFEFVLSDTGFSYSSFSGHFAYVGYGPDSSLLVEGYLDILQKDSILTGQRNIWLKDSAFLGITETGTGEVTGMISRDGTFSLYLTHSAFPSIMIKGVFSNKWFNGERFFVDTPPAPIPSGYYQIVRGCTEAGGYQGYELFLRPKDMRFISGEYAVFLTPQGDTTRSCSFTISNSYSGCVSGHCVGPENCNALYSVGYPWQDNVRILYSIIDVPVDVQIELDHVIVGYATFLPVYKTVFPNGLYCPPSGLYASNELVLEK